ncbi:MAG: alpha/beta fold hydrolase [Planctomycetes bacterium]|nr:alpha/beta fold hydrolase [Planctomycetota bacterium]MBL7042280.1 alpha/beta fold hydrolase [Pirellulaceae bacterium]
MLKNSATMCFRFDRVGVSFFRSIAIALFVFLICAPAWAQPVRPPAKKVPAADEKEKEKKPPAPQRVWLDTKDGWKIHCTYYGPKEGVRKGKETVPLIMIHGWGGQGSEYSHLAWGLQKLGHATIVPDLRGHGRSTDRKYPNGNIENMKYDDRKFTPQEREKMTLDIEACKKFLMEKNDAEEVNIEMLCVVGAELGSIIALNWAAMDWSWPQTPYVKQGQDVKALVLLSPRQSMERLNAATALTHPAVSQRLSLMFAVGENDRKSFSEASRIYNRIEKIRPEPPEDLAERLRKKNLFLMKAETTLQGTKLLGRALPVNGYIVKFIELRLLNKREDLPWSNRKGPIAEN